MVEFNEPVKNKFRKDQIILLLCLLLPVWMVGISNYFFASSSFIYVDLSISPERQWVGDIDGILMTFALSVSVCIFWAISVYTGYLDKCVNRVKNSFDQKVRFIKENKREVQKHIAILIAIGISALALSVVFSFGASVLSFVFFARTLFFATAGLSVYFIYVFRKKPELMFLSLSLLIGFLYIATQSVSWFGWDNGIHFAWSVEESFIRNVRVTRADYILSNIPESYSFFYYLEYRGINHEMSFTGNQYNATVFEFAKTADSLSPVWLRSSNIYTRLAHVPPGLMIFLGRSLALPPILILKLGVVANHLIYTALAYYAMKRLNSGKYILAVIAMFPSAFVLSTTFGYDHWIIGFFMLGFAYFFYERQNPDTKISKKSLIIMVASLFIGLGAKPVYVPMLLILYFMKKDKFESEKRYKIYTATITALILFAVLSFVIPFVTGAAIDDGDMRGGDGVNAFGQVMFILQNPVAYARMLLEFLARHLNAFTSNYVTLFARLGTSSFFYLVWILVGFVTLTDRGKEDLHTSGIKDKALMAFIVFATAALYSTSMYIAFTEVGFSTILGVQGRYKLPFLFPLLYILGGFKIKNNINETAYSCGVFGIMSFVLLVGAWEKFIPQELW